MPHSLQYIQVKYLKELGGRIVEDMLMSASDNIASPV